MINIFYNVKQSVEVSTFSPSPRKPKQVVDEWSSLFAGQIALKDFQPVTVEQLTKVHSHDYVTGVMSGRRVNGFGTTQPEVAESLLYTNGSMVAAAFDAIETGGVAVSPTSGFHHAQYNGGGGFCTYNGLVLAAVELHESGKAKKVGILDIDYHYADGTNDIIRRLNLDFIHHYTVGDEHYDRNEGDLFLSRLPSILRTFAGCDVVLYQAGADPHIDDPLGGFLTTEQLDARDHIVFSRLKSMGIPVAWNLAGGYQKPLEKVLEIHSNTMARCIEVYGELHESKAELDFC